MGFPSGTVQLRRPVGFGRRSIVSGPSRLVTNRPRLQAITMAPRETPPFYLPCALPGRVIRRD